MMMFMKKSEKIWLIVIAFSAAFWFLQRRSTTDQLFGRALKNVGEDELASFLV
jgi:hypothetical protein